VESSGKKEVPQISFNEDDAFHAVFEILENEADKKVKNEV